MMSALLKNSSMSEVKHLTMSELEAGLDEIRRAPKEAGVLELIVRRPRIESASAARAS
jgi:hypothetical protein